MKISERNRKKADDVCMSWSESGCCMIFNWKKKYKSKLEKYYVVIAF